MYTLPIGAKITSPTTTYTITGVLGSGGFGITYSATCVVTTDSTQATVNVALKEHFIKADCQRDETTSAVTYSEPARQRVELTRKDFIGEARRLKSISGCNPNIVTVSEVFEANNTAYYAMELLEGQSLRDYVAARGKLSESEMLSIMTPIVGAVAFLHYNRITHLDIKPQNIMISTDEDGRMRPVLIDFGLSKHYDENGDATSTINSQGYSDGYAPNEQYYGITKFSPASDVYSLAATMVYCLNGRKLPPAIEVTPEVLATELPNSLSTDLRNTLKKALSLRPANRHKDAEAMLATMIDDARLDRPHKARKIALMVLAVCLLVACIAYVMFITPSFSGNGKQAVQSANTAQNNQKTPSPQDEDEVEEEHVFADDELFPIIQGDKIGFADKDGTIIVPCGDYDRVYSFSDGLAAVEKDKKYGFIDKTGKEVITLEYDWADSFSEGLALVEKDGKWGFIDTTGKVVLTPKYDEVWEFNGGLARIQKGGKWGFIDKNGQEVIPLGKYDYAGTFSEGLAGVKKDGKYGFVDTTGTVVILMRYDYAGKFSDGLAMVKKGDWENGKYGFIDKTGTVVIQSKYDNAYEFSDGLAMVRIGDFDNGKWGFIDKTGKEVIPIEFDWVGSFSDGLAPVNKDGKYGFIDKTGKDVIPLIYESVGLFGVGLAMVKKDGKYGFIDKTGKLVIPLEYDDAYSFGSNGLAKVSKDGKVGYIDHFGNFMPRK